MKTIQKKINQFLIRISILIAIGLTISTSANAAVIDFDDITGVPGNAVNPNRPLGFIPDNYQGFVWEGIDNVGNSPVNVIKEDTFQVFYGNSSNFPSFDQALINNGSDVVRISSAVPFDFLGASFIAFGRDNLKDNFTSTSVDFRFYRGSTLVGPNPNYDIDPGFFSTINFTEGWTRGITAVEILASTFGTNASIRTSWIMDDMRFEREPITNNPVPEPSTGILIFMGLLAVSGFARKDKC